MSARTIPGIAVVAVATFAAATTATAATTPATSAPDTALFASLDEFVTSWNETNQDVHQRNSAALLVPLDQTLLVLRPADGRLSYFGWHVPTIGYLGGLVEIRSGDVEAAVVAAHGTKIGSLAATLALMTTETGGDLTTATDSFVEFVTDLVPGNAEYAPGDTVGMSMFAFDGVTPEQPWMALVAAPVSDEKQALAEAHLLTSLVAAAAAPAAPAPTAAAAAAAATTTTTTTTTISSSAAAPTTAPVAPTSTVPSAVALYPLDEFIGRWNEANALVAEQMSPSVNLPIDASALILRPINEQVSFFDWHFPAAGYVGGLVDNGTGDVYLAVVAGEPESPMMRSAAGTLLFMLTADRPADTATFGNAYRTFAADAQPGATDYLVAGPLGVSMLAFDGIEPGAPWVAVAAASPTEGERGIAEAAIVAGLVAGTAVPPAPAPEASAAGAETTAPAGMLARRSSAAPTTTTSPATPTTTVPAATTVPTVTTAPAATFVFPTIDAFVLAWNESVADLQAFDPTVETFVIDPAAVLRRPMPPGELLQGVDAFGAPIGTNGFVGGLVDQATGQVTGVLVGGDPDAQIVRSSVGVLFLSTLDPALAGPVAEAWAALAADTATVQVDYVVAGDLAVTLEVVAGAEQGDNLVSVFVGPPATTPEALAAPFLAYIAVFSLALSAPAPAPSTSGMPATTAAVAALPTTAASAASAAPAQPTTTALPMVSLVPPSPTTTSG